MRIYFVAVIFLSVWALFLNLGKPVLALWDEARLAVNSVEMYLNGNQLVPTFEGQPDLWNTKPPLMIILQVLSYRLWGVSEWALRFPSALAGLLTVIYIYIILNKEARNYAFAAGGAILLVGTKGFTGSHVCRTGDYDALLCLEVTIMVVEFYRYVTTLRYRHLFFYGVALTCAILTKSIQGLIFLPALAGSLLILRKFQPKIALPAVGATVGSFIIPAVYYWIREGVNPGYFQAVLSNEVLGRYTQGLEENHHPFYYYFEMINLQFMPQFLAAIPLIVFFVYRFRTFKLRPEMKFTLFLWGVSAFYFVIISLAATKLRWYIAPLYPLWAMVLTLTARMVFEYTPLKTKYKHVITGIGILTITAGYGAVLADSFGYRLTAERNSSEEQYGPFLNQLTAVCKEKKINNSEVQVLDTRYPAATLFYLNRLNIIQKELTFFHRHYRHDEKPLYSPGTVITFPKEIANDIRQQGIILTTLIENERFAAGRITLQSD